MTKNVVLNKNQELAATLIVSSSGWMDLTSYAELKPNQHEKLVAFVISMDDESLNSFIYNNFNTEEVYN